MVQDIAGKEEVVEFKAGHSEELASLEMCQHLCPVALDSKSLERLSCWIRVQCEIGWQVDSNLHIFSISGDETKNLDFRPVLDRSVSACHYLSRNHIRKLILSAVFADIGRHFLQDDSPLSPLQCHRRLAGLRLTVLGIFSINWGRPSVLAKNGPLWETLLG